MPAVTDDVTERPQRTPFDQGREGCSLQAAAPAHGRHRNHPIHQDSKNARSNGRIEIKAQSLASNTEIDR
jgi:hypothetical protein